MKVWFYLNLFIQENMLEADIDEVDEDYFCSSFCDLYIVACYRAFGPH